MINYFFILAWFLWKSIFSLLSHTDIVSFAAVIRVVTQCSSPTNGCSLELCIPFPLLLRTNNMHVTVNSYTNHISRYICRQRSRFPRNGGLLLIGQFKERNAALEWAAVSWGGALRDDPSNGWEGHYVARCKKKIVQVKETLFIFQASGHLTEHFSWNTHIQ